MGFDPETLAADMVSSMFISSSPCFPHFVNRGESKRYIRLIELKISQVEFDPYISTDLLDSWVDGSKLKFI